MHGQACVYDEKNGKNVAIVFEGKADAAFIVKACNAHEKLSAFVAMVAGMKQDGEDGFDEREFYEASNYLIDAARTLIGELQS